MNAREGYVLDKCDEVDVVWLSLSEDERLKKISFVIAKSGFSASVEATSALNSGFVYLKLLQNMNPGERGSFLLDLEGILKKEVNQGVSVWCDPLGDRNSLRKLRGVQIGKGEQSED